jgi:MFS family permease
VLYINSNAPIFGARMNPNPKPPNDSTIKQQLLAWLSVWFSSGGPDLRSSLQLEREKYILWHPSTGNYNRFMAILPCVIAQCILGSFYSTSVFNKPNDQKVWHEPGVNSRMFVTCVAVYGLCTLLLGSWVGRNGVFKSVRRTLFLTPLGWLSASLAVTYKIEALLYVYGILHGAGCAHAYISTTSCLAQWFPQSKGFMAGVAVFGAGAGSWIWTLAARALMNPAGPGMSPDKVMLIFALAFAILLALILPFLRNPPPNYSSPLTNSENTSILHRLSSISCSRKKNAQTEASASPDRVYSFLQAMSTREMFLTAVVIFSTSLPGVVFLSSASDMASNIFSLDAQTANLITSWLNLTNFCGRFLWGAITDIIGRKSFFILSSILQGSALLIMSSAIKSGSYEPWILCFLTIGSLYGGGFGVLPAFCAEMWGSKISSATHGALITTWALACIFGAPIFAAVNVSYSNIGHDGVKIPSREGYVINAIWLSTLPMISVIALLFLDVRREDRRAARAKNTCRMRVFTWVVTFSRADGVKFLDPQTQEDEYQACGGRDDLSEPTVQVPGNVTTKSIGMDVKSNADELDEAIKEWCNTGTVQYTARVDEGKVGSK